MNHLSDEQLEEVTQDEGVRAAHLEHCIECRGRLAEKEALASRLRLAFTTIKPGEELAERIRRQLNAGSMPAEHVQARGLLNINFHLRSRSAIAAAAAVLIIAIPLVIYLATPSSALAAQAELVRIHEDNLSAKHEFHNEADPKKVAEYFESKLGFSPIMPCAGQGHGRSLRGCCVTRFRGQMVGSYVVETPQGVMSIVIVTDQPRSLGMDRKFQLGERTFWSGSFAKCNLVAVRIGRYSYCAVGEVPDTYLTELLVQLVPRSQF